MLRGGTFDEIVDIVVPVGESTVGLLVLVVLLAEEGVELITLAELKFVESVGNEITLVKVVVLVIGVSGIKINVDVILTVPLTTVLTAVAG